MKTLTKNLIATASAGLLAILPHCASAQENLAGWFVLGNYTNTAGPEPLPIAYSDYHVIASPIVKGAGFIQNGGSGEYGGSNFVSSAGISTEAYAITNGSYVSFTIQAAPNYTISFSTNIFSSFITATGPIQGELQYSTDGINYTDIAAITYSSSRPTGSIGANTSTSLSGIAALQNVPATTTNYFRLVNWNASTATGDWYIFNPTPAGSILGLANTYGIYGSLQYQLQTAPTNLVVTPSSETISAGQTAVFQVNEAGNDASNFWYFVSNNTTNLIAGANESTLVISNVVALNAGNYFAVLTNLYGSATSSLVTLSVTNDPNIQTEPASVQGLLNGTVQFSVGAFGSAPLTYQWYYTDTNGNFIAPVSNGVNADGSIISGATSSLLNFANLQPNDATNFVVIVSNFSGSVTSSVAFFLMGTNVSAVADMGAVLALWDFDGSQFTNTFVNPSSINNPVPLIGSGTSEAVGTCFDPGTSPFSGATDPNDVGFDATFGGYVFTPYGFDQPSPNFSWGTDNYPVSGSQNKLNGVQFNVSTLGAKNIKINYDGRVSATASDYYRLQYTTNGTTFIDYPAASTFSGLRGSGNAGFFPFNYDLTGFPGVDNNSNFAFRVVSEYQSTATYQPASALANTNVLGANGVYATNFFVGTANTYFSGSSSTASAGTVTYDLVAVLGDAITNNGVAPMLSSFANTNMVDTNTLVLNFTASSSQTPANKLSFAVNSVNTVAAGVFHPTVEPSFSVANLGSTNFALTIFFSNGGIPDALDAAPILVTATDTNTGASTATSFLLTVASLNQPPTNTLTAIKITNSLVNVPLSIPFIAGSARDGTSTLTYAVSSDNNTVIPAGNIKVANLTTGKPTLTVTPAANQVGNSVITVTVSDNDPVEPRQTTASIDFTVLPNTNILAIDYFNYDGSGSLDTVAENYWTHLSGVNGQLQVENGVAVLDSVDNTENLIAPLLHSPHATNSAAVLYTSFTVNVVNGDLPTGNGSYITAFTDNSGNTADVEDCLVITTNGAAPGYYRLGIANESGSTGATARLFNQDLAPGVNYFVVTSLVLSNGFSTLWINPTNQQSASVLDTTPTVLYPIFNIFLRESGGDAGIVDLGNLLIGNNFNSVIYPPVANPDNFGVTEDTTNNVLTPLINDVSGGILTITGVTPDANGTAAISGGTNVLFTPANHFTGTSVIAYTIADNLGNTSSSAITVNVTNNPPLANPSYYSVAENSVNNVFTPLAQDLLQTPGGSLSLVSVTPGANGTATMSGNQILYTPNAGYVGADSVSYTFTDNVGGTSSSTVLVTVGSVPPIPLNAQFSAGRLVMSWTNPAYVLETSTNVAGPYVTIPSATSPYTNVVGTNPAGFFRLVQ
jgi:hypothetical protein